MHRYGIIIACTILIVCSNDIVTSPHADGAPYSRPATYIRALSAKAPTGSYQSLYSFQGSSDGANPYSGSLASVDGYLYGTTFSGGSGTCMTNNTTGCGTVFKISSSGVESVLYSFQGGADGYIGYSGLVDFNGTLYGTTVEGGSGCGCGTVFKIRRNGFERVLTAFRNADGANPYAGLTELNGALYGTTAFGGSAGKGTVFRIDQNGTEKPIYSFKGGSDGLYPFANLIAVGGVLYGTTTGGGGSGTGCGGEGCGTVFKVSPKGSESVIYAFQGGNDGAGPEASLTYVNGILYGTTTGGSGTGCGGPGCGTVFEVDGSGNEAILYSFGDASTGGYPAAPLTYRAGYFYGTTYTGGGTGCPLNGGIGCGTVFKLSTSGHESVLHAFQGGTDGAHPYSGLVFAGGFFYGTTYGGGNNGCAVAQGCGTVYRVKP